MGDFDDIEKRISHSTSLAPPTKVSSVSYSAHFQSRIQEFNSLLKCNSVIMNHRYRKSLGYKSAYKVSMECDIFKKVPLLSRRKATAFR